VTAGNFPRVPVLAGVTRDEGRFFAVSEGFATFDQAQYEGLVGALFGAAAPSVLAEYPFAAFRRRTLGLRDRRRDQRRRGDQDERTHRQPPFHNALRHQSVTEDVRDSPTGDRVIVPVEGATPSGP
jgi:hypothetical protein